MKFFHTFFTGSIVALLFIIALPGIATAQSYPPYTQPYDYPVTHLTAQYTPGLPNTGFAPLTAASFVFVLVLLGAAGVFVSPYVKRTIATTFR